MDPKWTKVIAVVVVVIVAGAGIAIYYVSTHKSTACSLTSTNPLIMDQAEKPDTLDPGVTFSTPGWAAVYGVYQTLIMYNGSSYTDFNGLLAKNWSQSADGFHWNFTLRSGVHFSNGDAFNAYVMWFSLYRSLAINQAPQFILAQNFWYPGVGYYDDPNITANTTADLTTELNTWNFLAPTASQIAAMAAPNQSFRALDANTIQLNLGAGYLDSPEFTVPYAYLLPSLVAPIAAAVDPAVVQSHGGVSASFNTWMAANMIGTGAYVFAGGFSPASSTTFTLTPDPNYWGATAAQSEPWNNGIQPAHTAIKTDFQGDTSLNAQDLKTGAAATASFTYLGPSTINDLKGANCVAATALPIVYGATAGSWFLYMNQSVAPFSNLSVRQAIAHAIDYQQIIQAAFGGYASQWVGPVPPSYPDYNPNNLAPYSYDLTLAKAEMAQSPWPNGYPNTLNYEYVDTPSWANVALLLKNDLAQIGIKINPIGITLDVLYQIQRIDPGTGACTSQESFNGGPFPIGQEFYTSDYISPDDWTQNVAISYGSANQCMSGYANATMDQLVLSAAGEHNAATASQEYATMTKMMYDNYTDVWLVVPTSFAVQNSALQGVISNPMGSALPYVMLYNTEHAG